MRICTYEGCVSPALDEKIRRLERHFDYPLGDSMRFRIDHGEDSTRFFRALGTAASVLAFDADGEVLGLVRLVCRDAVVPGPRAGASRTMKVAYFCDLKVRPSEQGGWTLARLLQAAERWARSRCEAAYAVVMEGSRKTPANYSGRARFPEFSLIAKVTLLRVAVSGDPNEPVDLSDLGVESVPWRAAATRRLEDDRVHVALGNAAQRSLAEPIGLSLRSGEATAVLEDTRRAKRLWVVGGDELVSMHLSNISFSGIDAASRLVRAALIRARQAGAQGVFVSVPPSSGRELADQIETDLKRSTVQRAGAEVWGHGWDENQDWAINTAEI